MTVTDQNETFPGGIRALIARYQRRRSRLTPHAGEELAPLDVDFKALAQIPLPVQPLPRPDGLSRVAKKRHFLLGELAGQSELAMLHGMLVAHLRKHTHPDHAPALFRRLWAEEQEWLLANLDLRWLVSAVITFAEVGETENDRKLAQSLKIFFSLMKLYEAERVYSGHAPQKPFGLGKRVKTALPLGMQDFSLLHGDLESSLLAPLWQDSHDAPAIGPLVRHLLDALNTDDGTIFRRFAHMRQAAERAEKKGA